MSRTFKIYLILLVIVMALLAFLQLNKSTLIDWSKSFDIQKTQPFGLYVLNQEIDQLMGAELDRITDTPYDYYTKDSLQAPHNILIIEQHITAQGVDKILEQVEKGSHLLLVADMRIDYLADTLNFNYLTAYPDYNHIELLASQYKADSVFIDKIPSRLGFHKIDTLTTTILGQNRSLTYQDELIKHANFIKIQHGKGEILIHTEPLMLTNYYLLKKDYYTYAEDVFSYLPPRKTVWFVDAPDDYISQSPLRFILDTPSLRYAWYTMLIGLFLFIIFHAKRKQRIVPIIAPHANMSADFVKTIGNLYLQEADYKDMAYKKVTYFLNNLRTELRIDTQDLNDLFWKRVQSKTAASSADIQALKPLIQKALHDKAPVNESELIKLNQLINQIYN